MRLRKIRARIRDVSLFELVTSFSVVIWGWERNIYEMENDKSLAHKTKSKATMKDPKFFSSQKIHCWLDRKKFSLTACLYSLSYVTVLYLSSGYWRHYLPIKSTICQSIYIESRLFLFIGSDITLITDRAVFTFSLHALWLASVFTLFLVLRQSSENRSNTYQR